MIKEAFEGREKLAGVEVKAVSRRAALKAPIEVDVAKGVVTVQCGQEPELLAEVCKLLIEDQEKPLLVEAVGYLNAAIQCIHRSKKAKVSPKPADK